jgi:hypothetical protein
MSCVLRFYGTTIDADVLLKRLAAISELTPYRVLRRGETYRRGSAERVAKESSLLFEFPSEEFAHLNDQTSSICAFLIEHEEALRMLSTAPGMEHAYVDVAIQMRDGTAYPVQDQEVSSELIQLLANVRLGFRISLWTSCHGEPH